MRIEQLEPRNLLASVGIDPTFGINGTLRASLLAVEDGGQVLAVEEGVFTVAVTRNNAGIIQQTFIAKYTDAGRIDRTWGTNGYNAVGLSRVDQMAYDDNTGALYVAGPAPGGLGIMHFHPGGRPDRGWGSTGDADGIETYAVEPIAGSQVVAEVKKLVPLPNGNVLVAMERTVTDNFGNYGTHNQRGDVALMKLRQYGGRAVEFGKRGVVTLLGSSQVITDSDFATRYERKLVSIGDVTVDDIGSSYHAVLTREVGTHTVNNDGRPSPGLTLEIKSRTVSSADGAIDPATAHSWTVYSTEDGTGRLFTPLLVAADENHGATVITRVTDRLRDRGVYAFTLTPGKRPAGVEFGTRGLYIDHVVRGDSGRYLAAESDGTVARFNAGFSLDRTFAARGLGRVDLGRPLLDIVTDNDDRALVIIANTLTRVV